MGRSFGGSPGEGGSPVSPPRRPPRAATSLPAARLVARSFPGYMRPDMRATASTSSPPFHHASPTRHQTVLINLFLLIAAGEISPGEIYIFRARLSVPDGANGRSKRCGRASAELRYANAEG